MSTDVAVEIVVPVHNEAASIAGTLRELHRAIAEDAGIALGLIVTEDGSSDGTAEVVEQLAAELPIRLVTSPHRKGYSRAVLDGLQAATVPYVGYVDGDGQYDPDDFIRLWQCREAADLVVGIRSPRRDSRARRAMSSAFGLVYRRAMGVRLADPSCPYGLARRTAIETLGFGSVPHLPQGFWWEYYARAQAAGLSIAEVPVRHLVRAAGRTQVYLPANLPTIAWTHGRGLTRLHRELRR